MDASKKEDYVKKRMKQVSYCGVYCPNCGANCRIPPKARALREAMIEGEYDEWGHGLEGFTPFWKFLDSLVNTNDSKSCRKESCGFPRCGMRKCAKNKDVEVCPLCKDYPCEKIIEFSRSEPTLIFDGERMKEIGLKKWFKEQEERRRKGFCYGNVRCGKCNIPEE